MSRHSTVIIHVCIKISIRMVYTVTLCNRNSIYVRIITTGGGITRGKRYIRYNSSEIIEAKIDAFRSIFFLSIIVYVISFSFYNSSSS